MASQEAGCVMKDVAGEIEVDWVAEIEGKGGSVEFQNDLAGCGCCLENWRDLMGRVDRVVGDEASPFCGMEFLACEFEDSWDGGCEFPDHDLEF
jgi:hypothetical protein